MNVTSGLRERDINGEYLMLISLIIVSGYMFIAAFRFPEAAAIFPQFTAGVTVILGFLLLLREYLPSFLQRIVSDSDDTTLSDTQNMIENDQENESEPSQDIDEESTSDSALVSTSNDVLITTLFIIGYGVVGYLFGILLATPLFIISYTVWFRQPGRVIALLTLIGTGLIYIFMRFTYSPLDEGILFGGL